MRASVFFFAFALFALVSAQTTDRFVIDDFTVNQNEGVLVTLTGNVNSSNGDAPVINGTIYYGGANNALCTNSLIGCGRNMRIEISDGQSGRLFTSQIFSSDTFPGITGEWDISNPKGGASVSYNVYDGNTNDYKNINVAGLGSVDFTEGGLATGLRFELISDLPSTFTVNLYDTTGAVCTGQAQFFSLPGVTVTSPSQITRDIDYSTFTGSCAKTSIGAVEIQIPSQDAVDATVYQIRGVGFPNPSASATPSATPSPIFPSQSPSNSPFPSPSQAPSQSNTPSAFPSQSRTPAASPSSSRSQTPAPSESRTPQPSRTQTPAPSQSRTPTPSTSKQCSVVCNCPVFTCHLVYSFDKHNKNLFFN